MLGGCEELERLVQKMKHYWNYYPYYGVKEPILQPNKKIKNVKLNNYKIYLGLSQIGVEGCNHLKRAQWPALQSLDLSNSI